MNRIYEKMLRCNSMAMSDRFDCEFGGKILVPPSILDDLTRRNVQWPIQFQLVSQAGMKTHVGVQEFTAREGRAYIPNWIMQNLAVGEDEMITLRNVSLPKGSFVKIRPHSSDFLDLTDPKTVLEMALRKYSCLTKNEKISIQYDDITYDFDVVELKPTDAVSIIETDIEVDFAPPADYVEPTPQPTSASTPSHALFSQAHSNDDNDNNSAQTASDRSNPTFVAFGGSGQRLSSKMSTGTAIAPAAAAAPQGHLLQASSRQDTAHIAKQARIGSRSSVSLQQAMDARQIGGSVLYDALSTAKQNTISAVSAPSNTNNHANSTNSSIPNGQASTGYQLGGGESTNVSKTSNGLNTASNTVKNNASRGFSERLGGRTLGDSNTPGRTLGGSNQTAGRTLGGSSQTPGRTLGSSNQTVDSSTSNRTALNGQTLGGQTLGGQTLNSSGTSKFGYTLSGKVVEVEPSNTNSPNTFKSSSSSSSTAPNKFAGRFTNRPRGSMFKRS